MKKHNSNESGFVLISNEILDWLINVIFSKLYFFSKILQKLRVVREEYKFTTKNSLRTIIEKYHNMVFGDIYKTFYVLIHVFLQFKKMLLL